VTEAVQHIDLVPTILEAVGEPVPGALEGRALRPLARSPSSWRQHRSAVSYMDYEGREGIAVARGGFKLIEPLSPGFLPSRVLFHRARDSAERVNLAEELPVRAGFLAMIARCRLAERSVAPSAPSLQDFEGETRRALEALGYLR
jgi:arylsulfatase A-like enzyme